jgi:DNA-binding LytR/AlgR family response regulator
MVKIRLSEILYIESLKDYVRVKTADRQVISHQRISNLEEKLPDNRFIRIHRSFIVPIRKVEAFSACHVEVKGKNIPIGRMYKSRVLEALNQFNVMSEA